MKLKKWKEKIRKRDLKHIYEKKYIYDFQQDETITSFGESCYTRKAETVEAEEDQSNLLKNIIEVNNKSGPRIKEGKDKKEILKKVHMIFIKVDN